MTRNFEGNGTPGCGAYLFVVALLAIAAYVAINWTK